MKTARTNRLDLKKAESNFIKFERACDEIVSKLEASIKKFNKLPESEKQSIRKSRRQKQNINETFPNKKRKGCSSCRKARNKFNEKIYNPENIENIKKQFEKKKSVYREMVKKQIKRTQVFMKQSNISRKEKVRLNKLIKRIEERISIQVVL